MKNLKVTIGAVTLILFSLTSVACTGNKKADTHDHATESMHDNSDGHHAKEAAHDDSDGHHSNKSTSSEERKITSATQENADISEIIDSYIAIKNGLVADSKEKAANGANMLLKAFANFDMSKLSGDTHKEYMEILESAKEQAEHISESPIAHQREHFETLSTDMADLVTLLGTTKKLYVDYCPMKKSSWLSETKSIKNPFYGSKMMTCGSVKSEIN